MGLLTEGKPMEWEDTKKYAQFIREHGIIQFLHLYHSLKSKTNDHLRWGDEIEYSIVKFDHVNKKAYLYLCATQLLPILQEKEKAILSGEDNDTLRTIWRPEYADYMLEGIPGQPYGHLMGHFNTVEANMTLRRQELQKLLSKNDVALSITAFPRLGCPNFTYPHHKVTPLAGITKSLFFPDDAICRIHPRFRTITRNIRIRRGGKVAINIPVYPDTQTPTPFPSTELASHLATTTGNNKEKDEDNNSVVLVGGAAAHNVIQGGAMQFNLAEEIKMAKPNHVYMDAMGFGMGCCCLQMTFQASSIDEARLLYDQLAPLCPIIMCLSAATPVVRGLLCDNDCRWDIISQSVDDRTSGELGLEPAQPGEYVIPKSRYSTIDCYLSACGEVYNDIPIVMNQAFYQQLIDDGVDKHLAQHVAHLFIRDPITLYEEKLKIDDTKDSDHFENIQSTNWQSLRFKPPPPNSDIGWRVEFRPTEVQITDFENAAFSTFIVLLSRVIATFKLNFLIPISKVDENFRTAMKRDAVLNGRFYFRRGEGLTTCSTPAEATEVCNRTSKRSCSMSEKFPGQIENCCDKMSVNDIVNGCDDFPGLIPLIKQYLRMVEGDPDTLCSIYQYLNLISKRASGELKTTASWIRSFITSHPNYAHDSRVTDVINYDLLWEIAQITRGESHPVDLLPKFQSRTKEEVPKATLASEKLLDSRRTIIQTNQASTSSTTTTQLPL